jgi:Zn-dependent protease
MADALDADMLGTVDSKIVDELDRLRRPRSSWLKTVLGLLVSVFLFFSLGLIASPLIDIAVLIGVLFFHEMGHFLAMRWFGYQDVRMFFIPFFGAAVSGRKTGAASYKEAIVVLAGPVPGLCLSLPLYLLSVHTETQALGHVALLLAAINGFNLLPVFPLDGGRLLQIVLFSRNRYVECVFRVVTALALLLMGWAMNVWIFYFLGGFMLLGIGPTFTISTIAMELRRELPLTSRTAAEEIPPPVLCEIVGRVRSRCPNLSGSKTIASMVYQVWEKMHTDPPGAAATVCLVGSYLFFVVAMLVVPVIVLVLMGWAKAG